MAGSITFTRRTHQPLERDGIEEIVYDWTCTAGGVVTGDTTAYSDGIIPWVNGVILRVITDPDATAPTDNYDITLTDQYGIDVLSGLGANRDTANSEEFCPGITLTDAAANAAPVPRAVSGPLTLNIANAGASKKGKLILLVR